MVIKLYGFAISGPAQRVAQTLIEKEVPFEFVPLNFKEAEHKSPAYLEKQPFGLVPYIDDDGFILYESRAIARYIAIKYADQGTPLIPDFKDLKAWALFEQASSSEVSNFDALVTKAVWEKRYKPMFGLVPDIAAFDEAVKGLGQKLDVFEKLLEGRAYMTGDNVSLVDLSYLPLGSSLYVVGAGHLIDSRPNISRWFKSLLERPSWVALKDGIKSTA